MDVPQCGHGPGASDHAILVVGDPEYGTLLNNATGRGCRDCLTRLAEFWIRQPFVTEVAVLPLSDLLALGVLEVARGSSLIPVMRA